MDYKARYLYSELAQAIGARKNCQGVSDRAEWFNKWEERISKLVDLLPHGSGFDSGTKIDLDASHADKLVFNTSFHHMDGSGYYCGWTEHTITVTPAFVGDFHIRVSGRNVNDIKEYIGEEFEHALHLDITYELLRPHLPQFAIEHKWEEKDGSPSQCYQALYVNTVDAQGMPCKRRFWNDYSGAREFASRQMAEAWDNPNVRKENL